MIAALVAVSAVAAADRVPAVSARADERAVLCEVEPPREAAGLEQCLQWSPRDVESILDLASRHEAEGRVDEALQLYRRVVALDPIDADARVRLAAALLASGQPEASRAEAARAVNLRPGDLEVRRLASLASGAR